jgi:hypothetical protein
VERVAGSAGRGAAHGRGAPFVLVTLGHAVTDLDTDIEVILSFYGLLSCSYGPRTGCGPERGPSSPRSER